MSKIKIISGWSSQGGSTFHHISLTNLLNENGYDCTFYGPQEWHLDKCKSGLFKDLEIIEAEDIIISHFCHPPSNINYKKHILSCHETNLFPLSKIDLSKYDLIHYVSNSQKKWHSVNHPSVIIPPIVDKIKWEDPKNRVAGIVGSIDPNKQTHVSIEAALKAGYDKVLLFGNICDAQYFNQSLTHWIDSADVQIMNHEDDREKMYSQISAVFHNSKRETYGLVEAECKLAGIPFIGPSNNQDIIDKKEILKRWEKIISFQ